MASGLRPYVISLAAVVLFSLFILLFAQNFIGATNPSSPLLNATFGLNSTAITRLNDTINNFTNTADKVRGDLANSSPEPVAYIFLIFRGAFTIPVAFLTFVTNAITTLPSIIFPALSGSAAGILLSLSLLVVIGVISVTIVLYIIKTIRSGEVDR